MPASALDKEFLAYFTQLDEAQKKSLMELLKSFLKNGQEAMQPMSLEEYNREIDEAMRQVDRGEDTTLEDLEKEMQSW